MKIVAHLYKTQSNAREGLNRFSDTIEDLHTYNYAELSLEYENTLHYFTGCDSVDVLRGKFFTDVIVEEPVDGYEEFILEAQGRTL